MPSKLDDASIKTQNSYNISSKGVSELLGKKIKNRFILNEFKEYLSKVEHNSENLEFFIWLDQYKTVYSAFTQMGDELPPMTTVGNTKNPKELYTFFKPSNTKGYSLLHLFKKVISGKKFTKSSSNSSEANTNTSERTANPYTPSIGRLSSMLSRKSNERSWKTMSQTSESLSMDEHASNKKSLSLDIQSPRQDSPLKASSSAAEGKFFVSHNSIDDDTDHLNPCNKQSTDEENGFDLTAVDEKMNEIVPWERQIEEIVKGSRSITSFKSLSHRYTYDNPQRISQLLSQDNDNSICFDFVDELSIIHESFSMKINEMFSQEDAATMSSTIHNLLDNSSTSAHTKSICSTSSFSRDSHTPSKPSIDNLENFNGSSINNCGSPNDSNIDEAYQSSKTTPNSSPQQAPQSTTTGCRKSAHVVPWELQLEEIENPDSEKYKKREEVEEIMVSEDLPLADHVKMCFKEFIFPGANKELNIPSKLKAELYSKVQTSTHPDIFGPIADHVYMGLRCQSFPAFMVYSAKKMTKDKLSKSEKAEK